MLQEKYSKIYFIFSFDFILSASDKIALLFYDILRYFIFWYIIWLSKFGEKQNHKKVALGIVNLKNN